jgi:myo-inositol-1(or 4)-monophosphatase
MEKDFSPKDIVPFLEDVTDRAGQAIMSYYQGNFRIDLKDTRPGGIDIVTDADRASEEIIMGAIRREFPDHDILTEETRTDDTGSQWLWLVDPLDGTVNFAHGIPIFSVSIALMNNGTLLAGMVYDPTRAEKYRAVRNEGAYLNGNPIRVSQADRLTRSIVATGFPYDRAYSPINNVAEFSRVVTRVGGIRRGGSAAIDLAYVSCGRLDGFWELKLKPWDMAAGMLLVKEAGGRITDRNGQPTDVYTDSIVATNGIVHDALVDILSREPSSA